MGISVSLKGNGQAVDPGGTAGTQEGDHKSTLSAEKMTKSHIHMTKFSVYVGAINKLQTHAKEHHSIFTIFSVSESEGSHELS